MKPFYPHQCSTCIFLGPYTENEGTDQAIPHDLYYCPQDGLSTVVARYGEDAPDYTSGLNSPHPALVEANNRAKAKGLTPDTPNKKEH